MQVGFPAESVSLMYVVTGMWLFLGGAPALDSGSSAMRPRATRLIRIRRLLCGISISFRASGITYPGSAPLYARSRSSVHYGRVM
jgi:hypothetical protein